jgi:hypothetical protein
MPKRMNRGLGVFFSCWNVPENPSQRMLFTLVDKPAGQQSVIENHRYECCLRPERAAYHSPGQRPGYCVGVNLRPVRTV